jgi:AraC family chitin signaling transcriptional activator
MFKPSTEDIWLDFYANFSKNNRKFVTDLSNKHNTLTNTQFKVCAYIRAGYSTSDIAKILKITKRSAEAHSFRLRKKFKLAHTQSLVTYLNIIN